MPVKILTIIILANLLLAFPARGLTQTNPDSKQFRTGKGLIVKVHNGFISVNNKNLYQLDNTEIIYNSGRNRLVENGGSAFLFLEIDGSPNLDRLHVFKISADCVDSVADAISSDLKDLDGDTFLEFGGTDMTEMYPARDSMYYTPYHYYEIRDGRVVYDTSCTKKIDIRENGIYLANPLAQTGFCCTAIPKPPNRKTYIVMDTSIGSERIDGPANIRDTIGGSLLFQLNDNVPVSTTDSINKWHKIGLYIDLNAAQFHTLQILQGSRMNAEGVQIGIALQTIKLRRVFREGEKYKGQLEGYTLMTNIKPATVPEKVISRIIRQHRPFDVADLHDFIDAFRFYDFTSRDHYPKLYGYYLNEGIAYGETPPWRMFLVFKERTLIGIVHTRKLEHTGLKEIKLQGRYSLTVLSKQDPRFIDSFIQQFNNYMVTAR